ncbi:methyltransferase type 11 [Phyllobacterium phragmitis]|uniref:Methyltransferase type 11 n=1 Tax=Phyllobacterium phragmitis TaxID=2670329 RepID=A0A2S9IKY3_9HYPH|nr:class I SAM-dependent methyltransferase [Phyllobacterium phragmitis]PRD41165.1 methyltransferase type 11 [Phyllobacterium phragmitis]
MTGFIGKQSESPNQPSESEAQPTSQGVVLDLAGYCPICEKETRFVAKDKWYRGSLLCQMCTNGSVPRERALALVLRETVPNWPNLFIHESSPMNRGISIVLKRDCENYVGSQYFPEQPFGTKVGEWQNENLEALTFPDNSFDLTITMDVMEHVFHPKLALQEIYRTLKPGGYYICTFPIRKYLTEPMTVRASIKNGEIVHADGITPEYHGNPVAKEALVTVDYGYDIHHLISYWTSFDTRIYRFSDRRHGIMGEYTEVVVCRKPDVNARLPAK